MTDRKRTTSAAPPTVRTRTVTHEGRFKTRIEWHDGCGITRVQTSHSGLCECVIIPADLARELGWTL